MNLNSKSILAKLLAKENITVTHGNYRTAFFDLEKRRLGLPLFKELDKDVYDLMIGHEVGHALETPLQGWHDSAEEIPKCPRAFINIIEDIRIEKIIQRQYPGLIPVFKRGYGKLKADNFFEIDGLDLNEMSFMNRLNLKSKLRDLVDIEFSAEETPYVQMAMSVETWDDVINACRSIYDYLKAKQDERQESGNRENNTKSSSENISSEDEPEFNSENFDDLTDETESSRMASNHKDSDKDADVEDQSINQKTQKELGDEFDTSTDDAYRKNEEKLLDLNRNNDIPVVVYGLSDAQAKEIIVPYQTILEDRNKSHKYRPSYCAENFDSFKKETKGIVSVMAKEFELKKAAYRYTRATTSKTGTLDTSKLHNYKYSDDIFKKVTKLADTKNHGIVMVIDMSISMEKIIHDVVKQTLSLAMFCKAVHIPFDVYTFTTSYSYSGDVKPEIQDYQIYHSDTMLCQVLSSEMNKQDFEESCEELFYFSLSSRMGRSKYDRMGSTPTTQVLSAMPKILSDFKKKYNIQKTTFVLLTDGEPSPFTYKDPEKSVGTSIMADLVLNVNGVSIRKNRNGEYSKGLMEYISSMEGMTTIGYFIAQDNLDYKTKIANAESSWKQDSFEKADSLMKSQKFLSYDNVFGYTKYFIMKGQRSRLNTDLDDFEVSENAKASEIARAFKKYSGSKKTNRIFAIQFAETIS